MIEGRRVIDVNHRGRVELGEVDVLISNGAKFTIDGEELDLKGLVSGYKSMKARLDVMEERFDSLWFAPGMPGALDAARDFKDTLTAATKSPDPVPERLPCAGFVVLTKSEPRKVLLVSNRLGQISFPKGKRNKGETMWEAAVRELYEETGLRVGALGVSRPDQAVYVDERSRSGKAAAIRLFVAQVATELAVAPKDTDELEKAEWVEVNHALSILEPKRCDVLTAALKVVIH